MNSRFRTLITTDLLLVVGLLIYVGLALGIQRWVNVPDPVRLNTLIALLLSGIPALLWLGYFYLQDRHEPEPTHYVFGVYLLGAFVAFPLSQFLVDLAAPLRSSGLGAVGMSSERLVYAIGIAGLCQELCKLLVVRYTIYRSSEFDERMDGIVYMTAAGIGFATAENLERLSALDGVHLSVAAVNAVVSTLAHACFAAVLGVALGEARFGKGGAARRSAVLLAGLGLAAVLSGLFQIIESRIGSSGLNASPWRGLAFAAAFAAVVFFAVHVGMRRQLASSPHKPAGATGGAA
jgi:RsiW-degrading membrane proteinase PrsW (M82 family)